MESAGDFSVWQWLADLLGPGGFVAFVAAGAEAWFIYKMHGWHRDERQEFHATCKTERDEWAERLESIDKEKSSRFEQMRLDDKEQWRAVGAATRAMRDVTAIVARLARAKSAPVRRNGR